VVWCLHVTGAAAQQNAQFAPPHQCSLGMARSRRPESSIKLEGWPREVWRISGRVGGDDFHG